MSKSALEATFLQTWKWASVLNNMSVVDPTPEYRFHPTRKWRFDFAWPRQKVAVELEGGIWTGGRHGTALGMIADMDKYNAAARQGWLVLRFSGKHLKADPQGVFETIVDCLNVWRTK
jgi:very-short-patch-repair endonuclease